MQYTRRIISKGVLFTIMARCVIIYGKLSKKQDEEYYTLNSQRWEIYDEVRRGEYAYRIPFKHFITIYDLKWFDFLLTDKGYD